MAPPMRDWPARKAFLQKIVLVKSLEKIAASRERQRRAYASTGKNKTTGTGNRLSDKKKLQSKIRNQRSPNCGLNSNSSTTAASLKS